MCTSNRSRENGFCFLEGIWQSNKPCIKIEFKKGLIIMSDYKSFQDGKYLVEDKQVKCLYSERNGVIEISNNDGKMILSISILYDDQVQVKDIVLNQTFAMLREETHSSFLNDEDLFHLGDHCIYLDNKEGQNEQECKVLRLKELFKLSDRAQNINNFAVHKSVFNNKKFIGDFEISDDRRLPDVEKLFYILNEEFHSPVYVNESLISPIQGTLALQYKLIVNIEIIEDEYINLQLSTEAATKLQV